MKGWLKMRNEKTLSLFLVIVMLFGYCATPISNAEQVKRFQSVKDQKKFKTLEQQKNEALESLKIQLKKQGKMHYYQKLKATIQIQMLKKLQRHIILLRNVMKVNLEIPENRILSIRLQ